MNKPILSYLLLDYNRPEESLNCLISLYKHSKFSYQVIYLSNGGTQDYALSYYKNGWIDKLILNKENNGCGNGTVQLFDSCDTDFAIYVQVDQELAHDIDKNHIETYKNVISDKYSYRCVDLAGAQAGSNTYSERAQFINVEFYKNIPKGIKNEYGGPGPFNMNRYTESYIQEYFKNNGYNVACTVPLFKDNGKWSVRQIGDGEYKHRCDTKVLFIEKTPTYRTEVFPPFDGPDWELALSGNWPKEGKVPNLWKDNVFKHWPD